MENSKKNINNQSSFLVSNFKKTSNLINKSKQYLHFENKNFLVNNSSLLDSKINRIKKLFENQQYVECEKKCNSLIKSNFNSKYIYLFWGLSLTKQNKFLEAIKIYIRALKLNNKDEDLLFNFAAVLKNKGENFNAIEQYKKILKINPNSIPALINISNLYNSICKYEDAAFFSAKIIELDSKSDKGFCNLGNAYFGMNKIEKALSIYNKGLIHNCNSSELLHNKALSLMLLEKYDSAIKLFEDGFKNKNLNNTSLIDYASCLFKLGNLTKSIEINKKALILYPSDFKILNNLGNIYSHMGDFRKADFYFKTVENLDPNNKEFIYNIALNYFNQNLFEQSIKYCSLSIDIDKEFFSAYNLLALCFEKINQIAKSLENFYKATILKPNSNVVWFNYGLFCLNNGKISDAQKFLTKSKNLGNKNPEIDLLINMSKFNNLDSEKSYFTKIHQKLNKAKITPNQISTYLLPSLYSDELCPQQIFEMHEYFGQFQVSNQIKANENNNQKIRIGYVSGDLNNHSVGYFFEPLIENHDFEKFDIYIYYNNIKQDDKSQIFQSYCKNWRNVYNFDDKYLFNLIKNDKIDILVDLSGHTAKNRLEVFKEKPAFKQVSWLGYPATTGLKSIDYKFTDIITDPVGKSEKYYTEKLYRIKDSFLCYKNTYNTIVSNTKPYESNGFTTFGSFNNFSKITKDNLEVWITILKNIPNSRLVLKSHQYRSDHASKQFIDFFDKHDVSIDRIKLLPFIKSIHGHLAMYNMIDISLDTFPFNGATTTMESLWMGVPVITLTGESHSSRVGTSILRNLNLEELIAKNKDDYINKAIVLSKHINNLKFYQKELRKKLKQSVLSDGKIFAKKIEKAYVEIYNEK